VRLRVFFNYSRINAGISNDKVDQHMVALFGEDKRIRLRSVEAQGQIECTFRRGKPVDFLVLARVLVLEI
jgi:hypothetical protein